MSSPDIQEGQLPFGAQHTRNQLLTPGDFTSLERSLVCSLILIGRRNENLFSVLWELPDGQRARPGDNLLPCHLVFYPISTFSDDSFNVL